MGIILEDDINPDLSFFPFINCLLYKYKNNNKIMMISGNNYITSNDKGIESYYFSKSQVRMDGQPGKGHGINLIYK